MLRIGLKENLTCFSSHCHEIKKVENCSMKKNACHPVTSFRGNYTVLAKTEFVLMCCLKKTRKIRIFVSFAQENGKTLKVGYVLD